MVDLATITASTTATPTQGATVTPGTIDAVFGALLQQMSADASQPITAMTAGMPLAAAPAGTMPVANPFMSASSTAALLQTQSADVDLSAAPVLFGSDGAPVRAMPGDQTAANAGTTSDKAAGFDISARLQRGARATQAAGETADAPAQNTTPNAAAPRTPWISNNRNLVLKSTIPSSDAVDVNDAPEAADGTDQDPAPAKDATDVLQPIDSSAAASTPMVSAPAAQTAMAPAVAADQDSQNGDALAAVPQTAPGKDAPATDPATAPATNQTDPAPFGVAPQQAAQPQTDQQQAAQEPAAVQSAAARPAPMPQPVQQQPVDQQAQSDQQQQADQQPQIAPQQQFVPHQAAAQQPQAGNPVADAQASAKDAVTVKAAETLAAPRSDSTVKTDAKPGSDAKPKVAEKSKSAGQAVTPDASVATSDATAQAAQPKSVEPTLATNDATAQPARPETGSAPPPAHHTASNDQPVPQPAQPAPTTEPPRPVIAEVQVRQQHHNADTPTSFDKLGVTIAAKSLEGLHQFDIRLDPVELGRVDVKLTVDASGQAQANLVVDNPKTLELLQRDASALNRALSDAGLNLTNGGLNFSLREQQQQDQGGNSPRGRSRNLSAAAAIAANQSATRSSSSGSYAPNSARLDIRV